MMQVENTPSAVRSIVHKYHLIPLNVPHLELDKHNVFHVLITYLNTPLPLHLNHLKIAPHCHIADY